MAAKPVLKAAYRVVGPKMVEQTYMANDFDKETRSVTSEMKTREVKMWMVYFPQGHSIRVDQAELKRLGYDKTPRIVDMLTGDVHDVGGSIYDFVSERDDRVDLLSMDEMEQDDADVSPPRKAKG